MRFAVLAVVGVVTLGVCTLRGHGVCERMVGEETRTATTGGKPILIVRSAVLTVVKGPETGRTARLSSPQFVIGSKANADLQIVDPSVSREHLHLSLEHSGHPCARPLEERHGLGGVRINDVLIQADTVLSLGSTSIALQLEARGSCSRSRAESTFGDAFGSAPVMRHLFSILEEAARSDIAVLLEGEERRRQDVLARAIHLASPRKNEPFVVADCGTMPPNLIESELFGHVRGAFTGATEDRRGLFEGGRWHHLPRRDRRAPARHAAEAPPRPRGEGEIRPVGGKKTKIAPDVRVVPRPAEASPKAAKRGTFREDPITTAFAVARVAVPLLRDRPEGTSSHRHALPPRPATRTRRSRPIRVDARGVRWPGNVRELRNVIERHVALGDSAIALLVDEKKVALQREGPVRPAPITRPASSCSKALRARLYPRRPCAHEWRRRSAAEHAQIARPSFYRLERLRIADDKKGDAVRGLMLSWPWLSRRRLLPCLAARSGNDASCWPWRELPTRAALRAAGSPA